MSSTTLVPQWFLKKRGTALSLVSMGGALSAATIPIINTWLIQNLGWQFGWRFWGVVLIVVLVPVSLIFTRNKPENVGLLPDNEDSKEDLLEENLVVKKISEINFNAKQVIKLKSFWIVLICSMIPSAIGTGMTFHMVSIMGEAGFSPAVAASVLSLMAISRLPVILITGQLADRLPVKYLMSASLLLLFLAMVVLINVNSIFLAMTFGLIRGVSMGMRAVTGGVVWPDYFGREHLGKIRGIAMTGMVIGSAFGPLPFGFAYDMFGGYSQILLISLIIPLAGAVAMFFADKPTEEDLEKVSS